ncbi:hypothetical protein GCM10009087_48180 [Sphingomonas oligophenolica]|uniref:S8 family serine peptidase n=1 Tax=Sphingomonas oligophenolica TaxID=301154 RepID=A0ABU9YCX0_9SPHN
MAETYTVLWRPAASQSTESLLRNRFGAEISGDGDTAQLSHVTIEPEEAAEIASGPGVEAIAPSLEIKLIEPLSANPTDSEPEWGIKAVGADTSEYSGNDVVVAVLDTGIDKHHLAFDGMDIRSRDFSGAGDGDLHGHGTHCAGTIFGRVVDGVRIGVAPGVKRALIGKVLDDTGGGTSQMIFDGLEWAIDGGANVISMSLGFDFPGQVAKRVKQGWPTELATSMALVAYRQNLAMFEAIMAKARAKNAFGSSPIVIAAAGNESRRGIDPKFRISASLPAVASDVSVAAVGQSGSNYVVANFSNSDASLCAPGVGIVSAKAGGGLHALSGTSMACPHVAGVSALWFEAVRKGGDDGATAVRSNLIARARRDCFGGAFQKIDFGSGLITAP